MTNKQFSIFMLAFLLVAMVVGGGAQSGLPIILPAQTSLANCTWPTSYATVTNGLALCPLNLSTGPALAIAVNGNTTFTQIPMTAAVAGVTSFNGRTGAINLTKADVLGTSFAVSTTVTSTATSTPQ